MITYNLIAPCGMNCGICLGYLREKNRCNGCRIKSGVNFKSREKCKIKNCIYLKEKKSGFCYDCEKYPCQRLRQLDKRYRTKYRMSMIDNLESIRNIGLNKFLENENQRWICPNCGEILCVHRDYCLNCKEKYR